MAPLPSASSHLGRVHHALLFLLAEISLLNTVAFHRKFLHQPTWIFTFPHPGPEQIPFLAQKKSKVRNSTATSLRVTSSDAWSCLA